ncbi:MAG: phage holin family protein [Bdellovibrionales bacterium]|nr:phage holin family protein [Bdellovibrionales bacterium]
MKAFLIRCIVQAAAILVVAYLLPGIHVSGVVAALVAAFCFGIVNALVKPLLILFTLPATIMTLGLFIFFINGFCFWLTSELVPGFEVTGAFTAIFGAVLVSIVSWLLNYLISDDSSHHGDFDHHNKHSSNSDHQVKVIKAKVISSS